MTRGRRLGVGCTFGQRISTKQGTALRHLFPTGTRRPAFASRICAIERTKIYTWRSLLLRKKLMISKASPERATNAHLLLLTRQVQHPLTTKRQVGKRKEAQQHFGNISAWRRSRVPVNDCLAKKDQESLRHMRFFCGGYKTVDKRTVVFESSKLADTGMVGPARAAN
jgi:hypothetical protein